MSLFEYVTVMVSMILALCLGHILRSVSFLAKTEQKVVLYLPHTIWSILLLLSVVNHWWSLWDLRDLDWSYASFLYVLAAPTLISFATGLLSPSRTESKPIELEAHYLRVRRLFFPTMVVYGFFMWLDGPLFADQELLGKVGALTIPITTATVIPIFTANRQLNAACGAVAITMLLLVMLARHSAT